MAVMTMAELEALYPATEGYKVVAGTETKDDNATFGGGVDNLQEGDILVLPTKLEELFCLTQESFQGSDGKPVKLRNPARCVVLDTESGEKRRLYTGTMNRRVRAYAQPAHEGDLPQFAGIRQSAGSAHAEFKGINKWGMFKQKIVALGAAGKKIKVTKKYDDVFIQERDAQNRPLPTVRSQALFDMELVLSYGLTQNHGA